MRVAFFEDHAATDFHPLTLLRPVFELVCGQFSARERMFRSQIVTEWGGLLREALAPTYRESHPEARVNDTLWLADGPTLLVNGRWLADPAALRNIDPADVGLINGTVAYLTLDPLEAILLTTEDWESAIYQVARDRHRVSAHGVLLKRPWDLIEQNPQQLVLDFTLRAPMAGNSSDPRIAILGDTASVSIDPSAQIDPFVVIDARRGPVSIDAGAMIQAFTRLEGPCHVGRASQLFRANVRGGTTIGPVCRVGGEIEAAILHGYVNKYHDGFLGHSYACPWVNLGALSTNSDLKNDYSEVQVPLEGEPVATGMTKVGCFIGDHTRTALGSLFNTGSSVGVMCMVLPGGELLPRYIPSFTSIWHGRLSQSFALERSFAAAAIAMERRNFEFTPATERLLRHLHTITRAERERAVAAAESRASKSESRKQKTTDRDDPFSPSPGA